MCRINNPKVIHETIDGETVMVNLDSGNYYSLDGVGADVWALIERGIPADEIVENIVHRHAGERNDMLKALHRFMDELQREGLISVFESEEFKSDARSGEKIENRSAKETLVFEAPVLHCYTDMQDVLLLDPIHDVDETGWPSAKSDPAIGEK